MKLYYFISKEESTLNKFQGVIYQEYEQINFYGDPAKKYKLLECFRLVISPDQEDYECVDFEFEFGKDSCRSHFADNLKDFKADFAKKRYGDWEPASRKEYEAYRAEVISIYQKRMFLDISSVKTEQDFTERSLTRK